MKEQLDFPVYVNPAYKMQYVGRVLDLDDF